MCALKAYIQIWGLYPIIEFFRENWRSQGHLINQEAEGVAPHPAESKLLRTSSRRRGGIGAQTLKEASVNQDAVQPQRGAASHQDKSAWGKTNFTFPWQQNKTE